MLIVVAIRKRANESQSQGNSGDTILNSTNVPANDEPQPPSASSPIPATYEVDGGKHTAVSSPSESAGQINEEMLRHWAEDALHSLEHFSLRKIIAIMKRCDLLEDLARKKAESIVFLRHPKEAQKWTLALRAIVQECTLSEGGVITDPASELLRMTWAFRMPLPGRQSEDERRHGVLGSGW